VPKVRASATEAHRELPGPFLPQRQCP